MTLYKGLYSVQSSAHKLLRHTCLWQEFFNPQWLVSVKSNTVFSTD